MGKPVTLSDDELNKIRKANKNNNKIIDDAIIDYLIFNEKGKRTKQGLIEEIKHCIYVAQCDYDQWGKDGNYSIQCIRGAEKFMAKYGFVK